MTSALFGAGSQSQQTTSYTGIQLQTSALGVALTLAYGVVRIGVNLIWYGDFKFIPDGQGGKAGGLSAGKSGGGNSGTYQAAVLMGLCEGPIDSIGTAWINKGQVAFSTTGMELFTGTTPQAPAGYLTTNHPGQDLNYNAVAYILSAGENLGSSAQLTQKTFEVRALLCNSIVPISDADCSLVITDMLTDPVHGAAFPSAKLGNLSTYQAYCNGTGFAFSVAYTAQKPVAQMLDDIMKATNSEIVWNGGVMNIIPRGDVAVGGYVPNLTPLFVLTNDDFVEDPNTPSQTPQQDPVAWTRKRPADAYNHIRVDYADGANAYNNAYVEVKNQALIDRFGLRTKGASGGDKLFRSGTMAYLSAALQLQRESIMNTCTFALDARYAVLDPMDIVSVPDPLGNQVLVRITDITENDVDTLSFQAEELLQGAGTAVLNGFQAASGFAPNSSVVPDSVNTSPLIFEPPSALASGQIWFGASGGSGGVADPNWGGCQILVSIDGGSTYNQIGAISSACRQGVLSGSLASYPGTPGSNPDNVDTPTFDMTMSATVLDSPGSVAASTFTSLCLVTNELFSYATSTLTGANKYQLATLYRGLYGTTAGAHVNGEPFMRLDGTLFRWDFPPTYVGVPLKFKFPSVNIFGGELQSLASCTAYSFTPT